MAGLPGRSNRRCSAVTEASDSTGQLDTSQDALVTLVVRGMVRGAPDDATKQLVEQGLALTKGPITMPTPQGTQEAGKLLRRPAGQRGGAGDRQALRRLPADQPPAARRVLGLADPPRRHAQRPQRRRLRRRCPGAARRGALLDRPDPAPARRRCAAADRLPSPPAGGARQVRRRRSVAGWRRRSWTPTTRCGCTCTRN